MIKDIIREIRWGYQRVVRGYDDRLTWGMDCYLTPIILAGLRELKEIKCGIPGSMFETEDMSDDEQAATKWDGIMNDMIYGFELMEAEWRGDVGGYHPNSPEYKAIEKGLALFARYYGALWT